MWLMLLCASDLNYRKNLDTWKIAIVILKVERRGFAIEYCVWKV